MGPRACKRESKRDDCSLTRSHRGLADLAAQGGRRPSKRQRLLGAAVSVAAHILVLFALVWTPASPPVTPDPQPMVVALVDGSVLAPPAPAPAPTPTPPSPAQKPAPPTPPTPKRPRPSHVKPIVRRHVVTAAAVETARAEARAAEDAPIATADPVLSAAQLAGATRADAGPMGGAECDMAGRLQAVLRRDRLVHAQIAGFSGKALRVWDGEWVWMRGDIGQGLTAVRQALIWEIAYAPEACRSKPMHGLVVFSVNEGHGNVRLAVGSDDWRWSDLLGLRSHRNL